MHYDETHINLTNVFSGISRYSYPLNMLYAHPNMIITLESMALNSTFTLLTSHAKIVTYDCKSRSVTFFLYIFQAVIHMSIGFTRVSKIYECQKWCSQLRL